MADVDTSPRWPRVCLVGPLPPPFGGMANQCEQLARLLECEGLLVELVRTNAPYRPEWIARVPMVRALFRLVPYLSRMWKAAGRCQVIHILANSGWAWHLIAMPAILIARVRRAAVIVNYRGGAADVFFSSTSAPVLRSLRCAQLRVTPSGFLQRVFAKHGLDAEVIPNIVDLSRFLPRIDSDARQPNFLVARNLELIYDISTALRAFARVRESFPQATLTVAGSGPELENLRSLAGTLGIAGAVEFTGRVDNVHMPALYERAFCALNPSTIDNMPISILEAYASGVPVISTDAGGIPDIVSDEVTGLLVPVGDHEAMADRACRVLADRGLRERLVAAGLNEAKKYAWSGIRPLWLGAYARAASEGAGR